MIETNVVPKMGTFVPISGTLVIGLGHKARQGKDTAAAILKGAFRDVERFAFADDLYAYCRVVHGMTTKDAPLLQRVGVELRETLDKDVWVRAAYAKMLDRRPRVAVITDVRFRNEFDAVKAMGGVCWRVTRVLPDGSRFVDPSRPANHVSETELDDAPWDLELENVDCARDVFSDRVLGAFRALALETENPPV